MHIPKHHLVKQLGGSSEWVWDYKPVVPGENHMQKCVTSTMLAASHRILTNRFRRDAEGVRAAQRDRDQLIAKYEEATRNWIKASAGDVTAEKKRRLAMLELRSQYHVLDPYIRGRGAYHRHGNILGNGLIYFEYPNAPGAETEGEWEVRGHGESLVLIATPLDLTFLFLKTIAGRSSRLRPRHSRPS